jgi:hypothetical protein
MWIQFGIDKFCYTSICPVQVLLTLIYFKGCVNMHVSELLYNKINPPTVRRRLKRQWLSDLPQPADDKN